MPWRPLPQIAFAICTYPFQPSSPADLPLQIGDELYIIEQGGDDGAWYRGYLVAPPSLLAGLTSTKGQPLEARVFSGIFPRVCVEIREILGELPPQEQDDAQDEGSAIIDEYSREPQTLGDGGNGDVGDPGDWPVPPTTPRQAKSNIPILTTSTMKVPLGPDSGTAEKNEEVPPALGTTEKDAQVPPPDHIEHEHGSSKPPAPVPMLKIGDETPMSKQEPLVDEIASCLREWHSTNLHELLLSRRYDLLDTMSELVARLDNARRQLLHKILTKEELALLREEAVWDLVHGNRLLSGEVIVRGPSEKGRILNAEDSPVRITQLQSIMSLLDKRPESPSEIKPLHHLLVDVKGLYTDKTEGVVFSIQLSSKVPGQALKTISEAFTIDPGSLDLSNIADSETKLKSLFADLSAADIGEVATRQSDLYLVVRVLSNEAPRTVFQQAPDSASAAGNNINSTWRSGTLKGGRRSLMWGPKGAVGLAKSVRPALSRPMTGTSLASAAPRIGTQATQKAAKPVKRITGVGVLDVGGILRDHHEFDTDLTIWSSLGTDGDGGEHVGGQNEIAKELLRDGSDSPLKSSSDRIRLHLKPFVHSDSEELIQTTPTLLQNVHATRKIGFSGAPTKPRSDIYLTLSQPSLPLNASLSHPKLGALPIPEDLDTGNLQLTLEVRKISGERIDHCIYPSSNSHGHTAWRTVAISSAESWNQTIRLSVDPEDVPGCHIVMSIANAPNFPFALCWMPLWTQEAFVRDGDHSLVLYKYDEYTSSMIAGQGAYLSLPWNSKAQDESIMGPAAAVRLQTFLCSTQYSQDPNLLGLLDSAGKDAGEMVELLKRFRYVPEIEIVKLLDQVFDALFDILAEHSGSEELEDLVFNALVIVLGIVYDRRFNLQPLVDQYADEKFNYPFATAPLIRAFTRLLSQPEDPENARRLRSTSKVGGHVLRFTINAIQQLKAKEAGIGLTSQGTSLAKDLQGIFTNLEALMRNSSAILVGTKTLLVQNFHTWIPELYVLRPEEVFSLASNFVESCANTHGRLALYRLILITHLSSSRLLTTSKTQAAWKANTGRWLAPYWGPAESNSQQWREQIRLCCSVVATQIDEGISDGSEHFVKLIRSYRALQSIPKPPSESLSLLYPVVFPFTTKETSINDKYDEGLLEVSALLASVANSSANLRIDVPESELPTFLLDTLQVYNSILDCEAFPKSWLSVHIFQHKSILNTLEKIMSLLASSFLPSPDEADTFNLELWSAYFSVLLKLVGSDALALETFPEQKRRAAWKIAGDVRESGSYLLQRSWEAIGWDTTPEEKKKYDLNKLGGYQVSFVPGLVGSILDLCLSVHDSLRHVAVTVLQNMIISEWILSNDLSIIQAEMIRCLDRLFKTRQLNDGMLQKGFITELTLTFAFSPQDHQDRDDPFFLAVGDLLGTIDELLDLLLAVHSTESTGEAFHIMDTLHLMEFLRDVQKEDIYITYVHKLAELQANSGNATEAGLALKMHADLYTWDPLSPISSLEDPFFPAQSAFERKERIYFQMIKYFEEGQAWHQALTAYSELSAQYQTNTFDFAKLARTQRSMAAIQDKISKGERQNPRYFRVIYRGLGFPTSLRDKQFIFEGLWTDRINSFVDKLQQQYPSARIVTGPAPDEFEGQYLSVYPVSPQKDLLHPVNRRSKVAQPIKDHFIFSTPNHFTTTSKRETSNVGVTEQLVEKLVFTTAENFPTILKRSEIVSTETTVLSPVQIGLERTLRKTQELRGLEARVADGNDSAFSALTEGLEILVNPTSNGCVVEYWKLVPAESQAPEKELENQAEEKGVNDSPAKQYEEALKVALIDHVLMISGCLDLYTKPAQVAKRAELTKALETNFKPVLAVIESLSQTAIIQPSRNPHLIRSRTATGAETLANGIRSTHHRGKSSVQTGWSDKEYVNPTGVRPPRKSSINRIFPTPPATREIVTDQHETVDRPSEDDPTTAVNGQRLPSMRIQSYSQNLTARMGSVTKRFSTLNVPKGLRRKTSKIAEE